MKNFVQKKWMLLIAILFVNLGAWAQTATAPAGTGTSGDPYQIATLNNLYWVTQNSSSWATGKYFIQTADIDATATNTWNSNGSGGFYGFSPIGNNTINFAGSYNGQNHTISGLYINLSATNYIGLFGMTSSTSIISGLGVTNVNFTGYGRVGGLIGDCRGSINQCFSTGAVSGSDNYVGGLAGNTGPGVGSITNCYSICNVSGSGKDRKSTRLNSSH